MRAIELYESLTKDEILELEYSNAWLTNTGLELSDEHREDIVNYYDGKIHSFVEGEEYEEENIYLSALYEGWIAINTRHAGGLALRGTKNGLLSHKRDIAKMIQVSDKKVFIDILSFSIPRTPVNIGDKDYYTAFWDNFVKIKTQEFDQFVKPHKIISWIESN